ncbi:MAG: hypothetical protein ACKN9T_09990 [Candidatus Methylumidiphilus sp.]
MGINYCESQETGGELALLRRGFEYGWIRVEWRPGMPTAEEVKKAWAANEAVFLPGILAEELPKFAADIAQAHRLMAQTREGLGLSELLDAPPYVERLRPTFELSGVSLEQHDDQGIEKVYFDAWRDDDIVADNLWCKASWLSFDEEEGSLRFRFSFGIEGYEDVAADPEREAWAAALTDAVFPESAAVTGHAGLNALLLDMLGCGRLAFAERRLFQRAERRGADAP